MGDVGLVLATLRTVPCASLQTTYQGKSSFQTYSDYLKWETFLQQQLQLFPDSSALRHGFQTCEHWKQIFMEIIGRGLQHLSLSLPSTLPSRHLARSQIFTPISFFFSCGARAPPDPSQDLVAVVLGAV